MGPQRALPHPQPTLKATHSTRSVCRPCIACMPNAALSVVKQCGGHSSSTSSASYHIHVPPSCLMYQLGGWAIDSSAHSPQLGWAADGFPVYGPHGPSGTRMQTCSVSVARCCWVVVTDMYCVDHRRYLRNCLVHRQLWRYVQGGCFNR